MEAVGDLRELVVGKPYYIQLDNSWLDSDQNNQLIGSGRLMATFREFKPSSNPQFGPEDDEFKFNNLREINRGPGRGLGNSGTNLVFSEIGEPSNGPMTTFTREMMGHFHIFYIKADEINRNNATESIREVFFKETRNRNDGNDLLPLIKDYLALNGGRRRKSRSVNKRNTKRHKRTTKRRQKKRNSRRRCV
jgi:hypothetical protein